MSDNDEIGSIIEFSEDISSAEAPPPIPRTDYSATIKDAQVKVSQTKGTRYCSVTFHIAPDQLPADFPADVYPDGVVIAYNRVGMEDNPGARYRLRKFCEAIGAVPSKRIDVSEWIGLEAVVSIAHETYEGLVRHTIDRVKPLQ